MHECLLCLMFWSLVWWVWVWHSVMTHRQHDQWPFNHDWKWILNAHLQMLNWTYIHLGFIWVWQLAELNIQSTLQKDAIPLKQSQSCCRFSRRNMADNGRLDIHHVIHVGHICIQTTWHLHYHYRSSFTMSSHVISYVNKPRKQSAKLQSGPHYQR